MRNWIRIKVTSAICAVAIVVGTGSALTYSQATVPAAATKPTSSLEAGTTSDRLVKLWQQYRSIHSIHCKATETEVVPGTNHPIAHGTYEYWADGSKFKIADLWNPAERPQAENKFFWDGKIFVHFVPGGNAPSRRYRTCVLIGPTAIAWKDVDECDLSRLADVVEPISLVPFVFLSPGGVDFGLGPTLEQIRSNSTQLGLMQLQGISKNVNPAIFPTGPYPDSTVAQSGFERPNGWIPESYQIRFGGKPAFLPTDIRLVLSTGVIVERYEIKYTTIHTRAGDFSMPSVVKETSTAPFAPQPNTGVFTFAVTQMEINVPIPLKTFTFDLKKARIVIDRDQQQR